MVLFRGMSIGQGALVVAAGLGLLVACGSDNSSTNDGQLGATAGNAGTSGGGASGTGNGAGGFSGQTLVGYDAQTAGIGSAQCSDGIDNDHDGLIDGFDPECTGPLDNDEATFATGIPGDNRDPKWQDCFFDGNSGAGDDGCRYATGCLTGDLPQTDPSCKLSQTCRNFCGGLVPNGCDCFGCCTIYTNGANPVDIEIGSGCSVDKISDTTACPRCTKSTMCQNTCDTCELCLGKTAMDLPASCAPKPVDAGTPTPDAAPPPPTYTCTTTGQATCGPTQPCASGYCSQGCCIVIH